MAKKPAILSILPPDSACRIYAPTGLVTDAIPAHILAVCIYPGDRVTYQVAWWEGRSRRTEWLEASEVQPHTEDQARKIGFRE